MAPSSSKFRFAWERHRAQVTFLPLIAVGLVVLSFTVGIEQSWTWMEPTLGLAGTALGVTVWWNQLIAGWRESLPKRLTARFVHENAPDQVLMICRNAPLSHEGDIRALCQQLGSQMAGNVKLSFRPNLAMTQTDGVTTHDALSGATYLDYEMTYFLTELPTCIAELKKAGSPAPYIEWVPPSFRDPRDVRCEAPPPDALVGGAGGPGRA